MKTFAFRFPAQPPRPVPRPSSDDPIARRLSDDLDRALVDAYIRQAAPANNSAEKCEEYFLVDMHEAVEALERGIPGLMAILAAGLRHTDVWDGSCHRFLNR